MDSVRHFEVYLHGRTFRVETDHKALEPLLSSRVLNRKLMRCVMRQPHNMAVAQPGKAVPLTRPEVPEV